MGRSITPTYRVEYRDNLIALNKTGGDATGADGRRCNTQIWNGKATKERLEAWRVSMNKSFAIGGVNWHLSIGVGILIHISSAAIVRQSNGKVVCEVQMPMLRLSDV